MSVNNVENDEGCFHHGLTGFTWVICSDSPLVHHTQAITEKLLKNLVISLFLILFDLCVLLGYRLRRLVAENQLELTVTRE